METVRLILFVCSSRADSTESCCFSYCTTNDASLSISGQIMTLWLYHKTVKPPARIRPGTNICLHRATILLLRTPASHCASRCSSSSTFFYSTNLWSVSDLRHPTICGTPICATTRTKQSPCLLERTIVTNQGIQAGQSY